VETAKAIIVPMKYVFAGSTSASGNAVLGRLVAKVGADKVTCLVRPTSDVRFLEGLGVQRAVADITEPDSYVGHLGPDVVYLDMTKPRYYDHSLRALRQAGVHRAYFVTTTSIFSRFQSLAEVYRDNERRIRSSELAWTILRPTMIYGSWRDHNMHKLIRTLNRYPVFPLFGGGRSLMQPVFADDLAAAIVAAMGEPATEGKEYNLGGPEAIPYRRIVETICELLDRRVRLVNVDTNVAYWLVRAIEWVPKLPITSEQVLRLKEDKAFDISSAVADLGYNPRPFAVGIAEEIRAMQAAEQL
jgi:nucleoside-diphosphate-sugar epimerase